MMAVFCHSAHHSSVRDLSRWKQNRAVAAGSDLSSLIHKHPTADESGLMSVHCWKPGCVCVCVVFSFILQLWHNNNWDTRDVWFVFIRKKKKIHKLKSNVQSFVSALQRHLLGPLLDTFRAVVFKTRVNPAPYFDHCFNELFRKTDNEKVQQLRWNNRVCRLQRSVSPV